MLDGVSEGADVTCEQYAKACKDLDCMSDGEVFATLGAIQNGYPYEKGEHRDGVPMPEWHELVHAEADNRKFR